MRCKECHYSLTDLSEVRCPECGTEFDPDDSDTYEAEPELSAFHGVLFGVGVIVLLAAATAIRSFVISSPGPHWPRVTEALFYASSKASPFLIIWLGIALPTLGLVWLRTRWKSRMGMQRGTQARK